MILAKGVPSEYKIVSQYSIENYLTHLRMLMKQKDNNEE